MVHILRLVFINCTQDYNTNKYQALTFLVSNYHNSQGLELQLITAYDEIKNSTEDDKLIMDPFVEHIITFFAFVPCGQCPAPYTS